MPLEWREALVAFLVAIMAHSVFASPYTISVATDKQEYAPGDRVTVSVSVSPRQTVVLLWELKDPKGTRRDFGQVTCAGGSCTFSLVTGSNWPTGTYTLIVAVSGTNDKGTATFTLRTPAAPTPTPAPAPSPAAVDYAQLSRTRIETTKRYLIELNATLSILSYLMNQLNLTLDPAYMEWLSRIAETLRNAVESYDKKDYENAYTLANSAYQEVTKLMESFTYDAIKALRGVVQSLLAKVEDPITVELLKTIDKELANALPTERDILTKLGVAGRILVLVARTLKLPELEKSLIELSRKAETLEEVVRGLNQSSIELQAQILALESEKVELAKQVRDLSHLVNELKGELDSAKRLNAELSGENSELKEQLAQSMPRNTAITAAMVAAIAGAAVGVALGRSLSRKKTS